jgi:hypothetical protein
MRAARTPGPIDYGFRFAGNQCIVCCVDSTHLSAENRGKSGGGSSSIWLAVLLLLHPLSLGPVAYLGGRGWVRREAAMLFYFPEVWMIDNTRAKWPGLTHWYTQYIESCHKAGLSHGSP